VLKISTPESLHDMLIRRLRGIIKSQMHFAHLSTGVESFKLFLYPLVFHESYSQYTYIMYHILYRRSRYRQQQLNVNRVQKRRERERERERKREMNHFQNNDIIITDPSVINIIRLISKKNGFLFNYPGKNVSYIII